MHSSAPAISSPPRGHGVLHLTVDAEHAGQRVDNFLMAHHRRLPRTLIYRWLRTGAVRINKARAQASTRVQAGDQVRVPPVHDLPAAPPVPVPSAGLADTLAARVLFEDDALLVVDKPAGLASHGGSGIALGLIEALRALRPQWSTLELCHRLDRDTSGCLLLAKKRSALRVVHEALRAGRVGKHYLALLCGELAQPAQVDAPLQRRESAGVRHVVVDADGQSARSDFHPRERWAGFTLAEVVLHTGRTHQIRVHAAHLGMPVAGDEKYGHRDQHAALRVRGLRRLFLHASVLTLPVLGSLPARSFRAPLPADLAGVLAGLRAAG